MQQLPETTNNVTDKPENSVDYVTYSISAEQLKAVSEFEASIYPSAKKESLYVRVHRLLGEKLRTFTLGGVITSNGAIDANEPVIIVYRRPLAFDEKTSQFEEGTRFFEEGKATYVEETAHVALDSPLGKRLHTIAMVFGPMYSALATQYSMAHIYYMATRIAESVIVGDPTTYPVIDQTIMRRQATTFNEQLTVYRMTYVGAGQTLDTVTRYPAIMMSHVIDTEYNTNIGEVFPVIRLGNRIAFNAFLEFDCSFTEPAYYTDGNEEDNEDLPDNQISIPDAMTFVNNPRLYQHIDRATGDLVK